MTYCTLSNPAISCGVPGTLLEKAPFTMSCECSSSLVRPERGRYRPPAHRGPEAKYLRGWGLFSLSQRIQHPSDNTSTRDLSTGFILSGGGVR